MVKFFTFIFSTLILIFTGTNLMFGQVPPTVEQEEAPSTVWDTQLGDAEVDLYIAGYWKIGIVGGLSFESGSNGVVFPAAFPGLTEFNFYQEPDITISLWLQNRFYLETSFLEGFDKNTYVVGYEGEEGEFLQSVRLGNSEISIDNYKGMNIPSPKYNTPGVKASFRGENSSHDLLLRYDPTNEMSKVFLGENEVVDEIIGLGNFRRGQHFVLPHQNLDFLKVYLAEENALLSGSDEKNYRELDSDEYSYSLAAGTLSLKDSASASLVVYYESSGDSVGENPVSEFIIPLVNGVPDPGATLLPFSWSTTDWWRSGTYHTTSSVTINEEKGLLLYEPGKMSPFESLNHYDIQNTIPEESWRSQVILADKSLQEAEDNGDYQFSIDSDNNLLILKNEMDLSERSSWSRYPLAENYPQVYGGDPIENSLTGKTLLVSVKNNKGLTLGPGVIPGSEVIKINGFETTSASVDYSSGAITFNRYIYPFDRIEVTYRRETTDYAGGDILVAQGNRFFPTEKTEIYFAEMFRWNMSQNESTTGDYSSPGGLTLASGMNYKGDSLQFEFNGKGEFQTPDTTGYLRLMSMEEKGYDVSLSSSLVVDSPDTVISDSTVYPSSTKSDLIFTDYYSTDGLGSYFLNTYDWSGSTIDTEMDGPSTASPLSSDPVDSSLMVIDYDMAAGNWSSGDLLLSSEGTLDLSSFTGLSFYLKKMNSTGTGSLNAYLFLGDNGEAEDWDGSGFIDNSDSDYIIPLDITSSLPGEDDQWIEITSDLPITDRHKLTACRSIRILLEESGGSPVSGRLLLGGFQLQGSLFSGKILDTESIPEQEIIYENHPLDSLLVQETNDQISQDLLSTYNEIEELFVDSESEQKALKVQWDFSSSVDSSDGDAWIIESYSSPISNDNYKDFSFYIYSDSSALAGTYEISITDSRDQGYSYVYSPTETGWQKLSFSLENGAVSLNVGEIIGNCTIDIDLGALTKFSIKGSDSPSGTLYVDELHYSDPSFSLSGRVDAKLSYNLPGTIFETKSGFSLLSDLKLNNQFSLLGGSVLSDQAQPFFSWENSSSLSLTLTALALEGNLKLEGNQEEISTSASHKIQFPKDFDYGSLQDRYSRSGSEENSSVSRSSNIEVRIPQIGSTTIKSNANGNGSNLVQNWQVESLWNFGQWSKLQLTGSLDQVSQWDQSDEDNYFSNWIQDYSLLLPSTDNVYNRSFDSALQWKFTPLFGEISLEPSLGFKLTDSPTQEFVTMGGGSLSAVFNIQIGEDSQWKISPKYSRSFSQQFDTTEEGSFAFGFTSLWENLNQWMPIYTSIPFYELFSSTSPSVFQNKVSYWDNADYSPEFSIDFSRKFGSEFYDLFLPYNIKTQFTRSFEKNDDSFSDNSTITLTFKQSAVNLFGRFGVRETFSFYDSEDISSSIQITISDDITAVHQLYLAFYGQNNSIFQFENRAETDFNQLVINDSLNFKFIWQRETKDTFAIDFINDFIQKEHFWSHEESLKVEFEKTEDFSININGKHLSKLNIPDLGSLKAWLTLGFYKERELLRAGFESGLELTLSF